MIVDIPTPGEFHTAGVNQLYLAWKITIGAQQALTRIGAAADDQEAADDYWRSVQPELANAYSLIQQAMEMALKGRIAAVSPFLLLGNPADWPGKGATEPLSFGELQTLDASKLVKVHNLLIDPPLDAAFATFWETVRRDRNRIMHSTSRTTFTAGAVVLAILRAAKTLFADMPWPDRLLAQEAGQKYAIFGMDDHVYSEVVPGALRLRSATACVCLSAMPCQLRAGFRGRPSQARPVFKQRRRRDGVALHLLRNGQHGRPPRLRISGLSRQRHHSQPMPDLPPGAGRAIRPDPRVPDPSTRRPT